MISLRVHSLIDYVIGAFLIVVPYLAGFHELDKARDVFLASGFFWILYSLFTDHEYSAYRIIPSGIHMALDVLTGVFVLIAPWIFNYVDVLTPGQEYLHYAIGLGVFTLVGLTREKAEAPTRLPIKPRVRTHAVATGRL